MLLKLPQELIDHILLLSGNYQAIKAFASSTHAEKIGIINVHYPVCKIDVVVIKPKVIKVEVLNGEKLFRKNYEISWKLLEYYDSCYLIPHGFKQHMAWFLIGACTCGMDDELKIMWNWKHVWTPYMYNETKLLMQNEFLYTVVKYCYITQDMINYITKDPDSLFNSVRIEEMNERVENYQNLAVAGALSEREYMKYLPIPYDLKNKGQFNSAMIEEMEYIKYLPTPRESEAYAELLKAFDFENVNGFIYFS